MLPLRLCPTRSICSDVCLCLEAGDANPDGAAAGSVDADQGGLGPETGTDTGSEGDGWTISLHSNVEFRNSDTPDGLFYKHGAVCVGLMPRISLSMLRV